jgi:hypothetical protein
MKSTPIEQRFWHNIHITDNCWFWTGAHTFGGYGVIRESGRQGKLIRAHRLSWEIHYGPIPIGKDICHHCDTPPCVRPDHLFLGTPAINTRDMVEKGRAKGGSPRGSKHPQAKLNEQQVIDIRSIYSSGHSSLNILAKQFGVCKRTVLNIVHRKVWIHI